MFRNRRRNLASSSRLGLALPKFSPLLASPLPRGTRLVGERLLHLLVAVEDPADGIIKRDPLPVRQNVDGDEVHVINQLGVLDENMPGFGRADRHLHGFAHPVQVGDDFFDAEIGAVERFVPTMTLLMVAG